MTDTKARRVIRGKAARTGEFEWTLWQCNKCPEYMLVPVEVWERVTKAIIAYKAATEIAKREGSMGIELLDEKRDELLAVADEIGGGDD